MPESHEFSLFLCFEKQTEMIKKLILYLAVAAVLPCFTACDDSDASTFGPLLWAYSSDEHSRFPGDEITIDVDRDGHDFKFRCVSRHHTWFAGATPSSVSTAEEVSEEGFYEGRMRNTTFDISFAPNTSGASREVKVRTAGDGGSFTFVFVQK